MMTMIKIPSRKTWCACGHGPLTFFFILLVFGYLFANPLLPTPFLEEDKRATTNVQNGLVFFLLFSSKKP